MVSEPAIEMLLPLLCHRSRRAAIPLVITTPNVKRRTMIPFPPDETVVRIIA